MAESVDAKLDTDPRQLLPKVAAPLPRPPGSCALAGRRLPGASKDPPHRPLWARDARSNHVKTRPGSGSERGAVQARPARREAAATHSEVVRPGLKMAGWHSPVTPPPSPPPRSASRAVRCRRRRRKSRLRTKLVPPEAQPREESLKRRQCGQGAPRASRRWRRRGVVVRPRDRRGLDPRGRRPSGDAAEGRGGAGALRARGYSRRRVSAGARVWRRSASIGTQVGNVGTAAPSQNRRLCREQFSGASGARWLRAEPGGSAEEPERAGTPDISTSPAQGLWRLDWLARPGRDCGTGRTPKAPALRPEGNSTAHGPGRRPLALREWRHRATVT
ncbi:hypothetical protein J1605_017848 [Eschrichtius robustus]|uniref:Uncharacterized protein n=1 Tax=Eschrichtius robustus TaxID=9764 RepID=A0AB34HZP8_ESCRO|nr:hypothetical protein J1605_017848 [Eschrichtius robustus]